MSDIGNTSIHNPSLIELYKPYKNTLKASSFFIGAGISQGFSFINLSNQDTAHFFKKQDYTASFSLILMIPAMLAPIVLQRLFPTTKHTYKAIASTVARIFAFFSIFISFQI